MKDYRYNRSCDCWDITITEVMGIYPYLNLASVMSTESLTTEDKELWKKIKAIGK